MDFLKIAILILVVPLIVLGVSGLNEFIATFGGAFDSLYQIPGIMPSLWSCVPTSITSIFLAIFIIALGVSIIKVALR